AARAFLEEQCRQAPQTPSSAIQALLRERFGLSVSISQINRVRATLGISNRRQSQQQEKKLQRGACFSSARVAGRCRQCTRLLRQATLPSSSLEAAGASLFAESDTEDLVMRAEREASVRSALASLPRQEQLVAALFYGCGYSYNEVSAFLKIPITTVKKRLHSARQKLRMQLQATLRNEIENANARPASNDEAAEIAGSAIRMARLLNRVAYTLEREASWQTSSNLNYTHSFLPRVA
ncbi:MAG TPA: sigma-70 family RNA polymerase sigma factor, partial [Ktedonobacteraceae bacterium]